MLRGEEQKLVLLFAHEILSLALASQLRTKQRVVYGGLGGPRRTPPRSPSAEAAAPRRRARMGDPPRGLAPPADPQSPEFAKALFETLVRGTRMSNAMPATGGEHEYATTFPAVNKRVRDDSALALRLCSRHCMHSDCDKFAHVAADGSRARPSCRLCHEQATRRCLRTTRCAVAFPLYVPSEDDASGASSDRAQGLAADGCRQRKVTRWFHMVPSVPITTFVCGSNVTRTSLQGLRSGCVSKTQRGPRVGVNIDGGFCL